MRCILLCLTTLMLSACGGLDPDTLPAQSTVQGSISYVGGATTWPDSILEVRVVLFDEQPAAPDSVLSAILNNRAAFTDTLPRFVETSTYTIPIPKPPHTFRYVVVAGRVGPNLLKDWLMLALYAEPGSPSIPAVLTVKEGVTVTLNFDVDFLHLPPQPF